MKLSSLFPFLLRKKEDVIVDKLRATIINIPLHNISYKQEITAYGSIVPQYTDFLPNSTPSSPDESEEKSLILAVSTYEGGKTRKYMVEAHCILSQGALHYMVFNNVVFYKHYAFVDEHNNKRIWHIWITRE